MRQSVNNMADITAKKRAKNSFHSSLLSLPRTTTEEQKKKSWNDKE